jgi:hypothetical protein
MYYNCRKYLSNKPNKNSTCHLAAPLHSLPEEAVCLGELWDQDSKRRRLSFGQKSQGRQPVCLSNFLAWQQKMKESNSGLYKVLLESDTLFEEDV